MARAGMSDEEITAFIKETFCVDSTYKAADLFAAAELPPSWQTVCTKLGLSTTRGTELLQNALLRATRDATGKGAHEVPVEKVNGGIARRVRGSMVVYEAETDDA